MHFFQVCWVSRVLLMQAKLKGDALGKENITAGDL